MPFQATANSQTDAETVVRHVIDELVEVLKARDDTDLITEKDMASIHDVANKYFDFTEMAKRSLSKKWKKLNKSQQHQFVTTFRALLERSYGSRLSGFQNQTVEYIGSETQGDNIIVSTEVVDEDRSIPIDYKLHQKNTWLIYDIRVESQSLVSTYRSDFKKIIKKKGFDGLMAVLESKLEQLKDSE